MMILTQSNQWVNLAYVATIDTYEGKYKDENGNEIPAYQIVAKLHSGDEAVLGIYENESDIEDILTNTLVACLNSDCPMFRMPKDRR